MFSQHFISHLLVHDPAVKCRFGFLLILASFPHSESLLWFHCATITCMYAYSWPTMLTNNWVQLTRPYLIGSSPNSGRKEYLLSPCEMRELTTEEVHDLPTITHQLSGGVRTHTWIKRHHTVEWETFVCPGRWLWGVSFQFHPHYWQEKRLRGEE